MSNILANVYESGETIVKVVVNFVESDSDSLNGYALQEYLIEIVFFDTIWMSTNPVQDDHVDFYNMYDLSNIDLPKNVAQLGNHRIKWFESGICQDSQMYIVNDSSWIPSSILAKDGYKHYVVLGRNMSVNIFGNKWTWQNKQKIVYSFPEN